MDRFSKELEKALRLQKEIYGDILFEKAALHKRRTSVQKNVSPEEERTAADYISLKNRGDDALPEAGNGYAGAAGMGKMVVDDKDGRVKSIVSDFENLQQNSTRYAEEASASAISDELTAQFNAAETLEELNTLICSCLNCPLGKGRKNFVFGSGNPNADILILGEGPGEQEDEQGLPFVGRSGQLLTDILKAINFSREEVYIANIVKCRPPGNRAPFPAEMEKCIPYLRKQIDLIKPKAILCLGLTAAQGLLKRRETLTNMRGKVFDFEGIKVMATYHPAALLRNPGWKRGCWEDVQAFRKLFDSIKK